MATDPPVIRDMALAERNAQNLRRWMDGWARGDRPKDLRNWKEKDAASDLHAKAAFLRNRAAKTHAARYKTDRVVNISTFKKRQQSGAVERQRPLFPLKD